MNAFFRSLGSLGSMFLIATLGLWLAAARPATADDLASVAGTTWRGTVGADAVSFEFKRDGTLIMTDAASPVSVRGTWKQEDGRLHLALAQFTFDATIRDKTFSGKTLVRGLCTYISATQVVAAAPAP